MFVGVSAADDMPSADTPNDDIGPLYDFDLFPGREHVDDDDDDDDGDRLKLTFRRFQQVRLCFTVLSMCLCLLGVTQYRLCLRG